MKPHAKWNIDDDHERSHEYEFNEGTWINLDVSPSGDELVFDFLGDLYTLPFPQGGEAKVFRRGVSFDIQPSYSPDGSKILFSSDQDGCDNIWVKHKSGEEQQVTFEPFHWVSNPKWVDNDNVVAVKWYTSTRSIGAGEVWKFQVPEKQATSNPGSRLVGRAAPQYQVGPEEPVSHGEYIYYSKNIRDGASYNYGKNPYAGIYNIFRLSPDGKTTRITGGAGGASKPVLSKDGQKLAFIKRHYLKTVLVIRDLEIGNEVILYDDLDFDQQESSAPAGTYPSFAFTPDDKNIVIWAKGKILRIDVSTGIATEVPFTVKSTLELAETVRFKQEVSNKEEPFKFTTKVALTPSSSNDNSVIAYSSVGRTYVKRGNEPAKALEISENSLAFSTSVSPDGHYVIHSLWNDHNLSTIQVTSLDNNNKVYSIPLEKGRYSFPSFSPDGSKIVYTRLPGDGQSGVLYSRNPGIYIISVTKRANGLEFGEPTLVTSDGDKAIFTSNGESLLVQDGGYPLTVSEYSIKKADFGKSLGVLASGLYCTDISVSPDKSKVAFIEFRHLYLQNLKYTENEAMNISARADLSTKSSSTQILHLEGGYHLTWSSDSQFIRWGWGPTFYTADASKMSGCKDMNCVSETLTKTDLSVVSPTGVAEAYYYLHNATILTMNKDLEVIEDGVIIVKNDRIEAVGKSGEIEKPKNAIEIDIEGGFILPGFLDVHAHWDGSWDADYKVKASWEFFANLAYGVTTVHNPSADTVSIFTDAELVRAGRKIGPRIFSTGEILYGAGGTHHCEISTVEDAKQYLTALKAVGAWSAKTYNQPCRQARQKLIQAARELKMNLVPEGGMSYYWNLNQIVDGHTTIEHSIPMAPLYKDVITLFAKSGTAWTPTFIVNYGGVMGEEYWYQNEKVWLDERANRFIPESVLLPRTIRRLAIEDEDYHHFNTSVAVKQVSDAGGLVNTGAHGQMQGIGFHWEMRMFEQGGMSVMDVIKAATVNPAKTHGIFHDVGSLEVGKLADLLIYDAKEDVINSVSSLREVKQIVMDGKILDARTMDQLYPVKQDAPELPVLNMPRV